MLRENSELLTNVHRTLDMVLVTIAFILSYCIKKYLLPGPLGGLSTEPNYYLVLLSSIFINFIVFNALSLYESQRSRSILNTVILNLKAILLSQFLFIFSLSSSCSFNQPCLLFPQCNNTFYSSVLK